MKYHIGFKIVEKDSDIRWLVSFPSSWMAFAPSDWFVFTGAMFSLFATGNGKPWTSAGAAVGFCSTTEVFYDEEILDYDVFM